MTRSHSRARRRTLDALGPHATVAHAHALACRAWQPYKHYGDPDVGVWLRRDLDLPLRRLPVEEAVGQLFSDAISDRDESGGQCDPPMPDELVGDLTDLPKEAYHPGSMHDHPALLDRADAITVCLPALVLALLDGTVPSALAEGAPADARRALVELHARYGDSDFNYAQLVHQLVQRGLRDPLAPDAPLELGDDWRWMVYVTQESASAGGGRLGAGDAMPLRCFTDLEFARRFAILQTDYSRDIAELPTDSAFRAAIDRLATEEPDGSDVTWEASTYVTVIEPRRTPVLTVTVPTGPADS
jgi:hypothetical protein